VKLLFLNVSTYRFSISKEHAYWNKIKRVCAEKIYTDVSGIEFQEKRSICRGLWTIASEANKLGHEVKWIDVSPDLPQISSEFYKWADQVWLYAISPTFNYLKRQAQYAKTVNNSVDIVIGGPHVRYLFDEILQRYTAFDFVEHEQAQATAIASFIDTPRLIPGIAYKNKKGKLVKIPSSYSENYRETIEDSFLPKSIDKYHLNISSSRGCSRNCSFCLDGKIKYCKRELDDFKNELMHIDTISKKNDIVHLFDTSIWSDSKRCLEISDFIENNLCNNIYSCDLDTRDVKLEILKAMHNARIRAVSIGFESCVDEVLNYVSKNGSFNERLELATKVKNEMPKTIIKAYWLLGLPGSTKRSLNKELEGIKYVLKNKFVDLVSSKLFVPYPGTIFFNNPSSYNLVLDKDFEKFDRFHTPPVCYPKDVGKSYLGKILLESEKLIANQYCERLGLSPDSVFNNDEIPTRYNGNLYTSYNEIS